MDHISDPAAADRDRPDRRKVPTSPWNALFRGGRRLKSRRSEEVLQPYFVDQFPPQTLILIVVLLVLSLADATITLVLLENGCVEINPVMSYLINKGPLAFLMGKYLLTAVGMPLLLVFKNFCLFGTRFRVGYLIPIFVGLYFVLLSYQFCLLRSSPLLSQYPWIAVNGITR